MVKEDGAAAAAAATAAALVSFPTRRAIVTAAAAAAAAAGDEEEVNVRVQGRGNCNLDKQKQSGKFWRQNRVCVIKENDENDAH